MKKVKKVKVTENKFASNFDKTRVKQSLVDFSGMLSQNDYRALKEHTEQARKEWNRDV